MLLLKQSPEDFYVEELLPKTYFENSIKGPRLYKLEKKNMSQKDAEKIIIEKMPKKQMFHFAGTKDKLAHTIQYFTTYSNLEDFQIDNSDSLIKITFQNITKESLYVGANIGNFFRIKTNYFKDYKSLSYIGVPNYFDSQRFQSKEFYEIIKSVIDKDYQNAIRKYLTRNSINEETNKIRQKINQVWPNIDTLDKNIIDIIFMQNEHKKMIYNYILENRFEDAFMQLNKKDISLMYKQFQSFLWNKLLDKIIATNKYIEFDSQKYNLAKIQNELFNLPSYNSDYKKYTNLFDLILKENGLKRDNLIIYKNESFRELFFFPKEVKQKRIDNNNAILEFKLPKGCYATTFIKHLYVLNNSNIKN